MNHPNMQQFKQWAREHYRMAETVCMAQAFAQLERERVSTYIKPLFDQFDFYVKKEWSKSDEPERITDPERIYLSDQESLVAEYFEACDAEHRKHGFKGKHGHCPALEAEELQRQAERAMLIVGGEFFGVDFEHIYGDDRKKALDLLMGACLMPENRKAA